MALEGIERLPAGAAAPQRLAGGGAEFGDLLGIARAAARAGDLLDAEQRPPAAARPADPENRA